MAGTVVLNAFVRMQSVLSGERDAYRVRERERDPPGI